jgi:hypothetical protein
MTPSLVRTFSVGVVLLIFSCWTTSLFAGNKEHEGTFDVVTLERTACFGACPEYKVEVDAQGAVKYEGRNDVAVKGLQTSKVSNSDLDFLRAAIKRMQFSDLRSTYEKASDGCKEVWTDLPSIIVTIKAGTSEKKVSYNTGCRGLLVLARIAWLADTIDEVTGSSQWVGPRMFGAK